MPTVRPRSRLAASDAGALEAYLSEATKSVAHELSPTVLSEETFVAEMVAIARCSTIKRPVLSFIVSWPDGSTVDVDEALDATRIAIKMVTGTDRLLSRIDAHGDAAHRHTHAAILLVDPETYRAPRVQLQRDRLDEIHRAIAERLGQNPAPVRTDREPLTAGARDAEVWNGTMSFERWLKREVEIVRPISWAEIDAHFAAAGIRREPGLIRGHRFVDETTSKTYRVRASKVGLEPARVHGWGPAPPPLALSTVPRTRPSYGELLQMRALPSPLLTNERLALHDRWIAARASIPGTLSQFGAWLRRQATNQETTNKATEKPTLKQQRVHSMGSIGDGRRKAVLTRDELLTAIGEARDGIEIEKIWNDSGRSLSELNRQLAWLGSEEQRVEFDDPEMRYGVSLDSDGYAMPLAGIQRLPEAERGRGGTIGSPERELTLQKRYSDLSEQYRDYLDMRFDADAHIGATLKNFNAERAEAERLLQRDSRAFRDADGGNRLYAAQEMASDLAALARGQERTTMTLALYQTELQALAPVSFAEFVRKDRALSEQEREDVLRLADADQRPAQPLDHGFRYNAALQSVAHLEAVERDDENAFVSRPLNDYGAGKLLFVERDGVLVVDRSNDLERIDAALITAAQLYDNQVTIEGDDRFIAAALERAVENGIVVTTPGLRERYAEMKAAHDARKPEGIALPAWASHQQPAASSAPRSEELVTELTVDGLRRLVAASAFGAGATAVVDARDVEEPVEASYVTTIVVDDVPVMVSQDHDGRILLSPLTPSAEAREELEYGSAIVINATEDRTVERVHEREGERGVSLAR